MQEVVKIGTQLRAARERALLTQEELGTRAGVQPLTISRIETDKVEPRYSTIRKLAKARRGAHRASNEGVTMPSTNGHGPKQAILYARVSTDEQARSGLPSPSNLKR